MASYWGYVDVPMSLENDQIKAFLAKLHEYHPQPSIEERLELKRGKTTVHGALGGRTTWTGLPA